MTTNIQKLLAARGSIAPLSPMRLVALEVRALRQLDYGGRYSKSIYVEANEVLELVAAARVLAEVEGDSLEIEELRLKLENSQAVTRAWKETALRLQTYLDRSSSEL